MSFNEHLLIRMVRAHIPAQSITVEPIRTGKFNDSYWVQADDTDLVMRIAPAYDAIFLFYERLMMRQEPQIHELVQLQTDVPVASILVFDSSRNHINRDYMIMERLPGQPLSAVPDLDQAAILEQVGHYLSQVHRIHAQDYGYLGTHKPMEPQTSWVDAFVIMWQKLIDDVVDVGWYSDEERSQLCNLLDTHVHCFEHDVRSSLLHMDIWAQNILVDDSSMVTGIIDWDRALWGDPEIEFATLDYSEISEPAFWHGYGQARDRSHETEIRRIFYLLYELQKYIVIYQGRNGDPAGALQKKKQAFRIIDESLAS